MSTCRHILLVDDEPMVLQGMEILLGRRRGDWALHTAGDVDAALAVLAEREIDAVVTDITMPGRDGFQLLAAVREDPRTRDVPVVILTGLADRDMKRRALELGATDLLNKPAAPEELIARIGNMLQLKAYQDQIKDYSHTLEQKVAERTAQLESAYLELIWRLARAAETRDERTGKHILRVGYYSQVVAEQLGLPPEMCRTLLHAAMLHDIGKLGIPDRILNKPGRFTDDEREAMKAHCRLGHDLLVSDNPLPGAGTATSSGNPFLETAAAIALAHHEKWDGSGYPAGLAGEAIPLAARIVAVVDCFDALVSERPYKSPLPEAEALAILRADSGGHFDPGVFTAFETTLDRIREIRTVYDDALQPA